MNAFILRHSRVFRSLLPLAFLLLKPHLYVPFCFNGECFLLCGTLQVDESLAQPLTWSRKETLPSGLWDLELLEDSDESGNDDDDDTTSSTRREYALVYAPW